VLNLLLLAGKILFLVVLYLFVFMVIRSAARELRLAAAAQRGRVDLSPFAEAGAAQAAPAGPAAGDGRWALSVLDSPVLPGGRSLLLAPGATLRLGRSSDNDLHLNDTFVSSHHARMSVTAEGLLLEDLGSTNGTFLNGEEVGRAWLQPGDEVAVGDTVFRVEVH
jgi:hypothetical protein